MLVYSRWPGAATLAFVLFVVCGINKISMRDIVVALWPFITLMYGVLVLCMLFPPIVTWLPRLLGYGS